MYIHCKSITLSTEIAYMPSITSYKRWFCILTAAVVLANFVCVDAAIAVDMQSTVAATQRSFGYSGLVLASNGELKGAIRLKTSAFGLVTGTLTTAKGSFVIRGSIAEGFPATRAGRSTSPGASASLAIQLRSLEDNARLEGDIVEPDSPSLHFWAERISFGSKAAPVSEVG